jgi:hypothetical protein
MRDKQLQEETAFTLAGLRVRLRREAAAVASVAHVARAGECSGDYVSDLVMDLRYLVAVLGQYADTLDGLRVQLDAESFTIMKVQAVADRAAIREFTKRVKG